MNCRGHLLLRTVLPALLLPALLGPTRAPLPKAAVDPVPAATQAEACETEVADGVSRVRPGARLRKLHLVRPDLIPYPIAHEVYC